MLRMLNDYVDHIKFTKNRSLLARIYGIYNISCPLINSVDIIVM